ncbi:Alkyl hydroperoxide reductase/ Thiol specific antioxidant [Modestobacter italicus]|uniref:Alkyl hydroperoxide reductase/ Thiol specific antioxidant n=1 Tax=Modestobacter italicus (strain DSM 44449 / CECT 9708 / BC 501) TaxID=2732864 RepID=I4EVF7_MODI5|nr:TlpA disulfide reductase family protein [Modestobacter marinus]CCH87370.1 Alkyl hydroperoxide reductase/ Thiol specific antioxidant [Modestobacter marinus]
MSIDLTRRRALVVFGLLGLSGLTGCSNDPGTAVADGEFDFAGSTPLGQVIPEGERQTAPAFSGELLDESTFESTALAGDIVVLNFWGSWCAPCRLEMPEFQTVYADVGDEGVQFLGVDVKDQRQLAQAFMDSVGVDYPSMFDPRGEVALAFRGFPANVVPTTILLDRSNRVAAVYIATVSEEDLRTGLDQLLAERVPG